MYLALFLVAMLSLMATKGEKQPFFKYGVLSALVVLFPVTRWILNRYFQGFYPADAWQWLLPVLGVISFTVMELWEKKGEKNWGKWQKRLFLPSICLIFLLCGGLSKAYTWQESSENTENAEEIQEIYEHILQQSGERQILLAAPKEIMEGARAYDAGLLTVYGRDLWETELDYAFYDKYEDWEYSLAEHMEEPVEMQEDTLLKELSMSGATHVVFDKENLTFGEDMQYPATLRSGSMTLKRLEETRHYVIYVRGE